MEISKLREYKLFISGRGKGFYLSFHPSIIFVMEMMKSHVARFTLITVVKVHP